MTKKWSRILFLLHNKTLLKTIVFRFKKDIKNENSISVETINAKSEHVFNYKFNCGNPRTFNEYLCWIKINYKNKLWEICADKLGSKRFLIENGFEKYVVKTYKIYKSSKEINLDELPDKFVLKTNHDSGSVFLCVKGKTDFAAVFDMLDQSIHKRYSDCNGEWVYDSIDPLIFAEEYIKPRVGKRLIDYKFFSFNGFFGWGFTGQDRETDTRFCVFEQDFAIQNVEYIYLKPRKKDMPTKPVDFDEMVNVSNKISKILDFVRVDFYDTDNGPKIGELTFFSQSGNGPFTKKKYDFKYGNYFKKTNLSKLIKNQNQEKIGN